MGPYQDIAVGRGCGLIDLHSLLADDLFRLLVTQGVLDKPDIRNWSLFQLTKARQEAVWCDDEIYREGGDDFFSR